MSKSKIGPVSATPAPEGSLKIESALDDTPQQITTSPTLDVSGLFPIFVRTDGVEIRGDTLASTGVNALQVTTGDGTPLDLFVVSNKGFAELSVRDAAAGLRVEHESGTPFSANLFVARTSSTNLFRVNSIGEVEVRPNSGAGGISIFTVYPEDAGDTAFNLFMNSAGSPVSILYVEDENEDPLVEWNGLGNLSLQFSAGEVALQSADATVKANGYYENVTLVTTATYSILATDSFVKVTAPGGGSLVTLPSAVGISGRNYTIKAVNGATNTTTVDTSLGQTIDGAASVSLSSDFAGVTVVSDGSNWLTKP